MEIKKITKAEYSRLRKELQMRGHPSARRRIKDQVSKALVVSNPKHTLFVLDDLSGIRNGAMICIVWESTILQITEYLIQLYQNKLCCKGCCQSPYDVTPL